MGEQRKGMSLKEWMRYLEEQERAAHKQVEGKDEGVQAVERQAAPQHISAFRPLSLGRIPRQQIRAPQNFTQPQRMQQVQQTQQPPKPSEDEGQARTQILQRRSFWFGIKSPRSQNRLDELLKRMLFQIARLQAEVGNYADRSPRWKLLSRLLDPDMSIRDVAVLLDVCETTVRRYTNSGLLEHYRTSGNQRRFRLSHVLKFIMQHGNDGLAGERT
ncbi:MAG: helix-turn-helix domain-containing protein [Armatimonadota bacterium]|nr:helix-turn-helix domain-containing protein [Armatimonadota bacterium]MCX7776484.1 helix-turn-helix domain-containing protein [Armatimonadota bacterium]MDW8024281.1 helix-turn-helix domain-containing protein [Armatimonadota bacterium]